MAASTYACSLEEDEKASYFTKLKQLGFHEENDDPFLLEQPGSQEYLEQWSTSVELWPVVEFGNIYVYLIDCPGYTHQSLKLYKSLDAYSYFTKGWVHQLYVRQSSIGYSIITGTVQGSHEMSNELHKAWVGISNEDGSILTGYCTCMAGVSSASVCVHLAAIVFQVEAAPHLPCSKANACLLCPYHQQSHLVKEEEVQENEAPWQTVNVPIKQDQLLGNDDEVQSLEADDLGEPDGVMSFEVSESDTSCGAETSERVPNAEHSVLTHMESQENDNVLLEKPTSQDKNKLQKSAKKPLKSKSGSHVCQACGSVLQSSRLLQKHKKTCHSIEVPQDEEMPSTSNQKSTGDDAVVLKPSDKSELHSCNICHVTFKTSHLLGKHMKSQHNEEYIKLEGKKQKTSYYSVEGSAKLKLKKVKKPSNYSLKDDMYEESDKITSPTVMKCNVCGEVSPLMSLPLEHVNPQMRTKFTCNKCSGTFKTDVTPSKRRNRRSGSGKQTFQCSKCKIRCSSQSSYNAHIQVCDGLKPYRCDECNVCCMTRSCLVIHKRTHTGEKPHQCNECGKRFNLKISLKRHVESHTGLKSFICDMCGKGYSRASGLKSHMLIHTGEKPFKCNECGKCFRHRENLTRHVKVHTGVKRFVCDLCGKQFHQKKDMQNHVRVHTGEKPFKCLECDKAFGSRGSLYNHSKVHKGEGKNLTAQNSFRMKPEKIFKCEECLMSFSRIAYLSSHMIMHMREDAFIAAPSDPATAKPYSCDVCGKSFISSEYRDLHVKLHSKVNQMRGPQFLKSSIKKGQRQDKDSQSRPFACDTCEMRFTFNANLHRHMRTHTGEKPFKCHHCGQCFRQSNTLHSHLRTHTGERPYKCTECNQAFTERRGLQRHFMREHGETSQKSYHI